MTTAESLHAFFKPRGVAVIGASQNPVKLSYGLARNLMQSNYQGVVHFVNPKGGGLFGRPIYPSILQVPDPVDLAILLIPAEAVPAALEECGKRGLKAAIIASGGFRETGEAGAALEADCVRIAQAHQMRLLGPNCIGFLDTHLPIDATFLPPPGPIPGDVAFISHSGAICAAVIDWARGQSFGLSRLVSLGNQADVNETDVLQPVAADPFTRVLTLYLEGISDGRRFVKEAGQVARQKPIIALKVGRYASGQRAVASHTGALAGQESVFNAAFRRAGVIRADTSEEIFDWARALAWCSPPAGRSVAVLTNAGGPGVTAADALEANGMTLAELAVETRDRLSALLPPAASLQNPVDMLASATPEQYADCLRLLLDDTSVHSVLIILPPPPMHTAGAVAKALIPVIHSAGKPVVIALMGERLIQEAVEHFRAARVPEYRFPERAASALAILARRAEFLQREPAPSLLGQEEQAPVADIDSKAVQSILESSTALPSPSPVAYLPAASANRIMQAYGIPVLPVELAASAAEAAELAERFGMPVALKIASPDILHKSDVGGVLLNLKGPQDVAHGYNTIVQNARSAMPEAELLGVYIQPMVPAGQDIIVGTIYDEQFGPVLVVGSGGVEVEGLNDVEFGLVPLGGEEAAMMLDNTWAGRKLRGFRHLPPHDRDAALEVMLRVSRLAADFPQLKMVEINPLRVLPAGLGVFAVDVRAALRENTYE